MLLEVTDSGTGIPAAVRAHIFEPFFTTKADGTGLGLSVSYGIIAAHGGTITIPKSSADGTMFRVALPAFDPGGEGSGGVATMLATPSPLAGARMLFVTSDTTMREQRPGLRTAAWLSRHSGFGCRRRARVRAERNLRSRGLRSRGAGNSRARVHPVAQRRAAAARAEAALRECVQGRGASTPTGWRSRGRWSWIGWRKPLLPCSNR